MADKNLEVASFIRANAPGARAPRGARCGVASVPFVFPDSLPMAGYSAMGKVGTNAAWDLRARAMVLEDDEGRVVAFAAADLMSASRYLHEATAERTRRGVSGLDVHEIVLIGTHTHTAPGNFYGNRLYDTVAQSKPGFRRDVADAMADVIAQSIEQAWLSAVPARVSRRTETLWGVSRNRSLIPFLQNPEAGGWSERHPAPDGLSPQQRAIDPRVIVLTAYNEAGGRIGTLATFACHNTALGRAQKYYAPDWTGIAASLVEEDLGNGSPVTLIGLSGAGDISPLAPDDAGVTHSGPSEQGVELARFVARNVAQAILNAHTQPVPLAPIRLKVWYEDWTPLDGAEIDGVAQTRLARWELGAPALGGAEDGRSVLYPLAYEGLDGDFFAPNHPQYPKAPALGVFGALAKHLIGLRPSPVHPLHVVQVGDHVFGTVPGEPTVCAAAQIEAALCTLDGVSTASVLGFAGDYAGYFTTRAEYQLQHYEGASTLYGGESTNHLTERLRRLGAGHAFAPPPRVTAGFETTNEAEVMALGIVEEGHSPRAAASGAFIRQDRLLAWWAWNAQNAPRTGVGAHLEIRKTGASDAQRFAPARIESFEVALGNASNLVWVVEFELDSDLDPATAVVSIDLPGLFTADPVSPRNAGSRAGLRTQATAR